MSKYDRCTVRKDLLKLGLGVPVGDFFYYSKEPLPYRWINEDSEDETFQVFYRGNWLEAHSIDFDFPLELISITFGV